MYEFTSLSLVPDHCDTWPVDVKAIQVRLSSLHGQVPPPARGEVYRLPAPITKTCPHYTRHNRTQPDPTPLRSMSIIAGMTAPIHNRPVSAQGPSRAAPSYPIKNQDPGPSQSHSSGSGHCNNFQPPMPPAALGSVSEMIYPTITPGSPSSQVYPNMQANNDHGEDILHIHIESTLNPGQALTLKATERLPGQLGVEHYALPTYATQYPVDVNCYPASSSESQQITGVVTHDESSDTILTASQGHSSDALSSISHGTGHGHSSPTGNNMDSDTWEQFPNAQKLAWILRNFDSSNGLVGFFQITNGPSQLGMCPLGAAGTYAASMAPRYQASKRPIKNPLEDATIQEVVRDHQQYADALYDAINNTTNVEDKPKSFEVKLVQDTSDTGVSESRKRAACAAIMVALINRCVLGYCGLPRKDKAKNDDNNLNCSQRINAVISALRVAKTVCRDVFYDDSRIALLVHQPFASVKDKKTIKLTNGSKATTAKKYKDAFHAQPETNATPPQHDVDTDRNDHRAQAVHRNGAANGVPVLSITRPASTPAPPVRSPPTRHAAALQMAGRATIASAAHKLMMSRQLPASAHPAATEAQSSALPSIPAAAASKKRARHDQETTEFKRMKKMPTSIRPGQSQYISNPLAPYSSANPPARNGRPMPQDVTHISQKSRAQSLVPRVDTIYPQGSHIQHPAFAQPVQLGGVTREPVGLQITPSLRFATGNLPEDGTQDEPNTGNVISRGTTPSDANARNDAYHGHVTNVRAQYPPTTRSPFPTHSYPPFDSGSSSHGSYH